MAKVDVVDGDCGEPRSFQTLYELPFLVDTDEKKEKITLMFLHVPSGRRDKYVPCSENEERFQKLAVAQREWLVFLRRFSGARLNRHEHAPVVIAVPDGSLIDLAIRIGTGVLRSAEPFLDVSAMPFYWRPTGANFAEREDFLRSRILGAEQSLKNFIDGPMLYHKSVLQADHDLMLRDARRVVLEQAPKDPEFINAVKGIGTRAANERLKECCRRALSNGPFGDFSGGNSKDFEAMLQKSLVNDRAELAKISLRKKLERKAADAAAASERARKDQEDRDFKEAAAAEDAISKKIERENRELSKLRKAARPLRSPHEQPETPPPGPPPAPPPLPAQTSVSNRARRRHEKRAKQNRARKVQENRREAAEAEEFQRILREVEPIRCLPDTVVKEQIETLDSVRLLDETLRKEEATLCISKFRPRQVLSDVGAAIFQINLWTSMMKYGNRS